MILGFHGKMRAGKNEAARRLAFLASSFPVVEVSFAAKLKLSAATLLGVTETQLEAWKNDSTVKVAIGDSYGSFEGQQTIRSFLQRYGTEAHRDIFGQDFWLDAALPLNRNYSDAIYVATDVRFANEAERVRELGGTVVLIVGPESDTGTHASEKPLTLDDVDLFLDNSVRDDNYTNLDRQLVSLLRYATERQAA